MSVELGYSPCPNDTFAFYAAREGLTDLEFEVRHHDVETLNRMAFERELGVTKLSFGALARLLDSYALLRSGGALGRGVGPLVVARDELDPVRLGSDDLDVVIPGELTTAHLLLRLHSPGFESAGELRFDDVMPAVAAGECDAGLVIHEGRFTYRDHGLVEVLDLGDWWESETGLPLPLGCVAVRRDVEAAGEVERALRESVEHALAHPDEPMEYVREHAQEMDPEVVRRHVELYVNEFTVDLGDEGLEAVEELFRRGAAAGVLPDYEVSLLAEE